MIRHNLTGVTSAVNSTTVPLAGGATFTGTWEDISDFATIAINGAADVAGTLWGDFSEDEGESLDSYRTVQLSSGSTSAWGIHTLVKVAKYFRVRVVNGASAQSSMAVTTIFSPEPLIAIATSRAAQAVNDYSSVLNTRVLSDIYLDEANGKQSDRTVVHKFGRNPDVAAGVQEDIWFGGATYTGFLTAAATVRVKSGGDAADTAAGVGARSVMIVGLDETWAEASEEVATAGASASSATTTTFIRVNRAYVMDVGTYGAANTGDIVLETSGGVTVASIQAGIGQTQLAIYTVPLGKKAFIRRFAATVEGSKASDIFMFQRANADVVSAPFTGKRLVHEFAALSGPISEDFKSYPGPFAAKTDIWVSGVGATGGNEIGADFDIVEVPA